ncbi:MAG: hypothetical protein KGP08_05010 [Xanthomonadaceae bacterium]|nr:hypothetical protein [Xanthomonadaceae bacterium]MDE2256956.1 hypothetical protein [Xanthomonadaceae bacterium]
MIRRVACAVALALVWIVVLGWAAGLSWHTPLMPARTKVLRGDTFRVVLGAGVQDDGALRVGAVGDDGNALQSAALDGIHAADYPILRYRFEEFPRTLELSLVFRRADSPRDVHSITIPWPGAGWRTVDLRGLPEWRGDIVELGFAEYATAQLVPPSAAFAPFRFDRVQLASPSWRGGLAALYTSWFAYVPWALNSISALVPDRATFGTASPLPALAPGMLLSVLVLALLLRWPWRRCARGAAVAAIVLWIFLDARWLRDFDARHALTEHLYAGKSWDERLHLLPDQDLAFMAAQVGGWLDSQPPGQRLLVAADSNYAFLRLIYLLLPHDVALLQLAGAAALPPGSLVLLYASTQWRYDEARGAIVGRRRDYPADPVFESGLAHVYRLRSGAP